MLGSKQGISYQETQKTATTVTACEIQENSCFLFGK